MKHPARIAAALAAAAAVALAAPATPALASGSTLSLSTQSEALILNIKPASSSQPGGDSGAPSPEAYAIQGVRSCRLLLAGANARSCIRSIVRTANARCRMLHSQRGRTRCLRAVRRATRRSS